MPSFCTLQVAINGGSPAGGGIAAAYSDSIVLSLASTADVTTVRYLIRGYPPGWGAPSGWAYLSGTLTNEDGYTLFRDVVGGAPCPAFTLPASVTWGKWIFDAYVNSDGKARNTTPCGLEIVSAHGVHDTAPLETTEFAGWLQALQADLRKLEDALAASGGSGASSFVIFRPATASSGPYVETWAEVAALVAAGGIRDLFVDPTGLPGGSYPTATTGVVDFRGLTTIRPLFPDLATCFLYMDEGAVFHDIGFPAVDGPVIVYPQCTATRAFTFSSFEAALGVTNGGSITTGDVATIAPIHHTNAAGALDIFVSNGGFIGCDADPSVCLVEVDAATSIIVRVTNVEYGNPILNYTFKGAGAVSIVGDETYDPNGITPGSPGIAQLDVSFKESSGSGYLPDKIVDLSGGSLSLLRSDTHGRCLVLRGNLPSDVAITLASDTRCKIRNECSPGGSAYLVTVNGVGHGSVWCPPGCEIEVCDASGAGEFRAASDAGDVQLSQTFSIVKPVGSTSLPAFALPLYFLIKNVFVIPKSVPSGGTSTLSIGLSPGGSDLIPGITVGGVGYAAGITLAQLGSAMPSADGYRCLMTTAGVVHFTQVQSVAACTAGDYAVVVQGQVLQ